MRAFPMFIKTTGRRVVIVGGGEEATQKFRLLSKTDAQIVLCAKTLGDELTKAVERGAAVQFDGDITPDVFADTAMVFIGTGDEAVDEAMHAMAKQVGALVNVVDNPPLCDMTTPSLVDRDPVVIAIGSEGTAPVLGRLIKTKIEGMLSPNVGKLAKHAGEMRGRVNKVFAGRQRPFWAWVFRQGPMQLYARGHEKMGNAAIEAALQSGEIPFENNRHPISVISTDCQGYDLLTLRAVACLQEADVIYLEPNVDPAIMELPRRDARRVPISQDADQQAQVINEALKHQDAGKRIAMVLAPNSPLSSVLRAKASGRMMMHHQGQAH